MGTNSRWGNNDDDKTRQSHGISYWKNNGTGRKNKNGKKPIVASMLSMTTTNTTIPFWRSRMRTGRKPFPRCSKRSVSGKTTKSSRNGFMRTTKLVLLGGGRQRPASNSDNRETSLKFSGCHNDDTLRTSDVITVTTTTTTRSSSSSILSSTRSTHLAAA